MREREKKSENNETGKKCRSSTSAKFIMVERGLSLRPNCNFLNAFYSRVVSRQLRKHLFDLYVMGWRMVLRNWHDDPSQYGSKSA